MFGRSPIEPKKFFIFVAVVFLLLTVIYASIVVTHHFVCSKKAQEPGSCLQKGMCTANDGALVPCSFLNPDGSYKQKEVG